MATAPPVLDLTTDQARPTVRIDRVEYLLRTSNDLTLDAYKTLERIAPRIGALLSLDALTEAQGSEVSQLLDQACRLALVAPAAVHDRLGDVNRVGVFTAFSQLLTPSLRTTRAALQGALPSPGPKPSRASSASTAAPSRGGSPRRRSASSGRA